jgi:hypothetical protein
VEPVEAEIREIRERYGPSVKIHCASVLEGGVEIDGLCRCNRMILDQRHISRTRTGAKSMHGARTGWKRRCSFRTRTGANIMYGGKTGWKRTVFL